MYGPSKPFNVLLRTSKRECLRHSQTFFRKEKLKSLSQHVSTGACNEVWWRPYPTNLPPPPHHPLLDSPPSLPDPLPPPQLVCLCQCLRLCSFSLTSHPPPTHLQTTIFPPLSLSLLSLPPSPLSLPTCPPPPLPPAPPNSLGGADVCVFTRSVVPDALAL